MFALEFRFFSFEFGDSVNDFALNFSDFIIKLCLLNAWCFSAFAHSF